MFASTSVEVMESVILHPAFSASVILIVLELSWQRGVGSKHSFEPRPTPHFIRSSGQLVAATLVLVSLIPAIDFREELALNCKSALSALEGHAGSATRGRGGSEGSGLDERLEGDSNMVDYDIETIVITNGARLGSWALFSFTRPVRLQVLALLVLAPYAVDLLLQYLQHLSAGSLFRGSELDEQQGWESEGGACNAPWSTDEMLVVPPGSWSRDESGPLHPDQHQGLRASHLSHYCSSGGSTGGRAGVSTAATIPVVTASQTTSDRSRTFECAGEPHRPSAAGDYSLPLAAFPLTAATAGSAVDPPAFSQSHRGFLKLLRRLFLFSSVFFLLQRVLQTLMLLFAQRHRLETATSYDEVPTCQAFASSLSHSSASQVTAVAAATAAYSTSSSSEPAPLSTTLHLKPDAHSSLEDVGQLIQIAALGVMIAVPALCHHLRSFVATPRAAAAAASISKADFDASSGTPARPDEFNHQAEPKPGGATGRVENPLSPPIQLVKDKRAAGQVGVDVLCGVVTGVPLQPQGVDVSSCKGVVLTTASYGIEGKTIGSSAACPEGTGFSAFAATHADNVNKGGLAAAVRSTPVVIGGHDASEPLQRDTQIPARIGTVVRVTSPFSSLCGSTSRNETDLIAESGLRYRLFSDDGEGSLCEGLQGQSVPTLHPREHMTSPTKTCDRAATLGWSVSIPLPADGAGGAPTTLSSPFDASVGLGASQSPPAGGPLTSEARAAPVPTMAFNGEGAMSPSFTNAYFSEKYVSPGSFVETPRSADGGRSGASGSQHNAKATRCLGVTVPSRSAELQPSSSAPFLPLRATRRADYPAARPRHLQLLPSSERRAVSYARQCGVWSCCVPVSHVDAETVVAAQYLILVTSCGVKTLHGWLAGAQVFQLALLAQIILIMWIGLSRCLVIHGRRVEQIAAGGGAARTLLLLSGGPVVADGKRRPKKALAGPERKASKLCSLGERSSRDFLLNFPSTEASIQRHSTSVADSSCLPTWSHVADFESPPKVGKSKGGRQQVGKDGSDIGRRFWPWLASQPPFSGGSGGARRDAAKASLLVTGLRDPWGAALAAAVAFGAIQVLLVASPSLLVNAFAPSSGSPIVSQMSSSLQATSVTAVSGLLEIDSFKSSALPPLPSAGSKPLRRNLHSNYIWETHGSEKSTTANRGRSTGGLFFKRLSFPALTPSAEEPRVAVFSASSPLLLAGSPRATNFQVETSAFNKFVATSVLFFKSSYLRVAKGKEAHGVGLPVPATPSSSAVHTSSSSGVATAIRGHQTPFPGVLGKLGINFPSFMTHWRRLKAAPAGVVYEVDEKDADADDPFSFPAALRRFSPLLPSVPEYAVALGYIASLLLLLLLVLLTYCQLTKHWSLQVWLGRDADCLQLPQEPPAVDADCVLSLGSGNRSLPPLQAYSIQMAPLGAGRRATQAPPPPLGESSGSALSLHGIFIVPSSCSSSLAAPLHLALPPRRPTAAILRSSLPSTASAASLVSRADVERRWRLLLQFAAALSADRAELRQWRLVFLWTVVLPAAVPISWVAAVAFGLPLLLPVVLLAEGLRWTLLIVQTAVAWFCLFTSMGHSLDTDLDLDLGGMDLDHELDLAIGFEEPARSD